MNRPLRRPRPPPMPPQGSAAAGSRNPAPSFRHGRREPASPAAPGLPLPHRLAIAYLLLPVGVWLVGWFEWWFGVPAVALLCCGLRHTFGGGFREGRLPACEPLRHPQAGAAPAGPTPGNTWTGARTPRPSAATAVAVAAALCWVMVTAAGGFFDLQNGDWYEHRTMLLDLGRHPWPPYLPDHLAAYLPQREDTAPTLLRYYLGWHMVPGLAARWLGPAALDWAVPLWTWAGVALILVLFARGCRGWEAAGAVAMLVFFGGMDLLRVAVLLGWEGWIAPIVEGDAGGDALRWWRKANLHWWRKGYLLDLEPPMPTLMWTPQHFIPAGLYALLCLHLRGRSRFLAASGVLLAAAPFWSAFVAVGLLPFVAVLLRENGLRPFLRWPNLLLAGPLAMLVASYLASGALDFPSGWLWEEIGRRKAAIRLPVLYVSEFALLALLLCVVRPGLRREPFFIAGVATLLLLPLYRYGLANDLLKRGAMPALILLAWFCAHTVVGQGGSILRTGGRRRLALAGLVAALAVGLLVPLTELARGFQRPGAFRHEQVAYTTLVDLPAQWQRQNVTRDVPPALRSLLRDPGHPAPRTARGELLSRSVFDVWLDDGKLIFTKARCTPSELERRFFVRSIPRDMDDLPAHRARSGFDRGLGSRPETIGGKCVSAVSLPAYPLARLLTGQRRGEQVHWSVEVAFDDRGRPRRHPQGAGLRRGPAVPAAGRRAARRRRRPALPMARPPG